MIKLPVIKSSDVGGVIVAYNPDNSFYTRVEIVSKQVDFLIIVDNSDIASIDLDNIKVDNVEVVCKSENLGVAKALNLGLMLLISMGYNWAITFDQDSTPKTDMLEEMLHTYNHMDDDYKNDLIFIAPNIIDENALSQKAKWLKKSKIIPFLYTRVSCGKDDLYDVSIVITSGCLTNIKIYLDLGPFLDHYFIDYVDTEYCLRPFS